MHFNTLKPWYVYMISMYASIQYTAIKLSLAGVIISGSWDKNVKVWDPRHQQPVITASNPERVSF